MGKALIIGCGGVASVAIHKCCQNSGVFEEICIASRTKSKCDALKEKLQGTTKTKITTAQVDANHVEELVSLGRLERGSKDYKDKKNIITRAVGTEDKLLVDFFEVGLEPGDFILMCSDGLSNMLEDVEMEEIVGSDLELEEKAEKLITVANDNGGKDNIAVVLVDPQIGREVSL